jgi:predicted amidophosphoribosyltransferase
MKYRPSAYLVKHTAGILQEELPRMFDERSWDLVIPIPSSPSMLTKRLFHPCYEIAKVVTRHLPHAKVTPLLRHARSRKPQARLSHEERLRGLRNFFHVKKPHTVSRKRVLLVEDVITTGATITAAAHALYAAGATEVDVVSLAQARVWSRFRALLFRTGVGHRSQT